MKKTLLSALVAGAFAVGISGQASATTFYFEAWGGFTGAQQGYPDPEFSVVTTPGLYQHLHWPDSATLPSSQSINVVSSWAGNEAQLHDTAYYDPSITGAIQVNTDGSVIGSMVHNNNPISAAEFDGLAQVNYWLNIYSDPAKTNLLWTSGVMNFTTEIWETPNGDNPCANGDPNGEGVNVNGCADQFSYALGYPVPSSGNTFDQQIDDPFSYDGNSYKVYMSGFWDKNDNLVGAFWSPEDDWSRMNVRAQVVPEPASMALMGLGLIGLGLARRYRNKV